MTKLKRLFLCALVSVMALSCAEESIDVTTDFPKESYLKWIENNAPNADSLSNDVFIEFKERAENWESLAGPILDTSWVRVNYTGRTLNGDVFQTRDSALSKQMGTWAYTTHFVDDYLYYRSGGNMLCEGLVTALGAMRAGDSARVYIPADMGYGSVMGENDGYIGTTGSYLGFPVYFDIRLNVIDNNPYVDEVARLNAWVAENWGMTEKDTLREGFYIRVLESNPGGDIITKDSTATYNYESYFLDMKPIETTFEELAEEWGYYNSKTAYDPVTITPSVFEDTISEYRVLPMTVLEMRRGEIAEAAVTSKWAGQAGDLAAKPQIMPYECQLFKIYLKEIEVEEEDEESDE